MHLIIKARWMKGLGAQGLVGNGEIAEVGRRHPWWSAGGRYMQCMMVHAVHDGKPMWLFRGGRALSHTCTWGPVGCCMSRQVRADECWPPPQPADPPAGCERRGSGTIARGCWSRASSAAGACRCRGQTCMAVAVGCGEAALRTQGVQVTLRAASAHSVVAADPGEYINGIGGRGTRCGMLSHCCGVCCALCP